MAHAAKRNDTQKKGWVPILRRLLFLLALVGPATRFLVGCFFKPAWSWRKVRISVFFYFFWGGGVCGFGGFFTPTYYYAHRERSDSIIMYAIVHVWMRRYYYYFLNGSPLDRHRPREKRKKRKKTTEICKAWGCKGNVKAKTCLLWYRETWVEHADLGQQTTFFAFSSISPSFQHKAPRCIRGTNLEASRYRLFLSQSNQYS